MLALTDLYDNRLEAAIASLRRGLELADQIGDLRQQSLSGAVATMVFREQDDVVAVRRQAERTQAAARRLGSERLEAMGTEGLARVLLQEGRPREALGMARQALALCERSGGLPVSGPFVLSILALTEEDPSSARAALTRGEALLDRGSACHNHFELREVAITLALRWRAWDEVRRHAAALERHLEEERTARAVLVVEGARLLAELGENPPATRARDRLTHLRAGAAASGLGQLARWLHGPG